MNFAKWSVVIFCVILLGPPVLIFLMTIGSQRGRDEL